MPIPPPPTSTLAGESPADIEGVRVVLVDDEAMVVRVVQRLLERAGCEVAVFTDPAEALGAIRDHPERFDLLLTDMTMPELSGVELARGAAAAGATMPVVLLSGWIDHQAEQDARAAGVARILTKPLQTDALIETVRELARPTRH